MSKIFTLKELEKAGYDKSTWIAINDRIWTMLYKNNVLPHEFYYDWNWNYEFTNTIINNDHFVYWEFKHTEWFIKTWISRLWAIAYFVYSWDFVLELTAKYRKTYNSKYGSNYNDIIKWNIEDNNLDNIQIAFTWSEGWKLKWLKNIELFLYLKDNIDKTELRRIYLLEHYGIDSLEYNNFMKNEY